MKIKLFTIPNLLTLANLFCGCMALIYTLEFGDLEIAFLLVMLAAVFDFLDGFAARLLKSYSPLGVQLDSLSDMVSFGVVPSAVLYIIYTDSGGMEWWRYGAYAVFIVALFSALRLGKFNIDEDQKTEFTGLPTPACAIFIASAGWLFDNWNYVVAPVYVLVVAVGMAYLLISPVRMFSLKFGNYSFRDNAVRYIFLALSLAAIIWFRIAAVPFIIILYILTSLALNIVCPKTR